MAITSFKTALDESAYVLIADGATYSSVALQAEGPYGVKLFLGASEPAVDVDDAIILNGKEPSFSIDLDVATKLYARSERGSMNVRGYKKA